MRLLPSAVGAAALYARAVAPLVPGASHLPWVAGHGRCVPERELVLEDVHVDPAHLARYARVCGFRLGAPLPVTYPHVLAFGLHMQLMTRGDFPFAPVGLVHVENSITQHRPIRVEEVLELRAHATQPEPHPKGKTFTLVTEARVGGELVWEDVSTMLRRGGQSGDFRRAAPRTAPPPLPVRAQWALPGDLGRRYAAASGDRNPIHLTGVSARLFGFSDAIAHGMWTQARCVAALEGRLPRAFRVDVAFRKPIALPATVTFASTRTAAVTRFGVRATRGGSAHLDGTITPRHRERRSPA
jgi:acyl dehydratase